ncbi:HNH endonuclease signature motif containing protein [Microbacterium awajiense]|uniref:HNH endonuclease signature motif containing protein n=1 Tax=Microbacterium awajiense TaxID=415214 RepID=A0ABP7A2S1_9MICO
MDRFSDPTIDEAYAAGASGGLSLVLDVDAAMATFAAERFEAIGALRRTAMSGLDYGASTEIALRSLRLELAAALRVSDYTAGRLLDLADALTDRFPRVLESLGRARITQQHAEVLVDVVSEAEPELQAGLAAEGLLLAEEVPVAAFRRAFRERVAAARAVTLAERHEEAVRNRRVYYQDDVAGMAWLSLYGPAVELKAGLNRLTAIAQPISRCADEVRTLDQVRADALCDLLIDGTTPHLPDTATGIRATVAVTVPVLTLLGVDETTPATVEGVGPIPAAQARELCGGSREWMRVLTHPETGVVLSVGRDTYKPPADLTRLVNWRAGTCQAPGCGMPAARCELDHTIAWVDGGHTAENNLAPLCKGHHTVKHHGNWRVMQAPGGVLHWTSPTGRAYVAHPQRRTPSFRPAGSDTTAATGTDPPF